jgi:aspartyl-tRNA(Asn)/glutamyl-tRNA(Gln) amidotransferase subunit A
MLVRASLDRIAAENPRLNAFITVMRDDALKNAAALDAEARAGRLRSPLHGIPLALKDAIDTAGSRTTAGSAVYADRVPTSDAEVARRLRKSGAVIVAKANLAEFSLSPTSASTHFGPVHNPWALDRVSGGSSGGSAAAVASRMCAAALGTDSGGSVRLPASWCGVVGLKPTHGLVPNTGIIPSVATLDTCGPIARTVEDAALVLSQITGYDAQDVASVDHPPEDYASLARQPVNTLRVGIPRKNFFDDVDPEVAQAVESAICVIETLASSVKDVALPQEAASSDIVIELAEIVAYHRKLFPEQATRYQPVTYNILEWCFAFFSNLKEGTPPEMVARYVDARDSIWRLRRTIDAAFTDFDVVVVPTIKSLPPTIESAVNYEIKSAADAPPMFSIENTLTFNRVGLPALTVPCGFSSEGLPIGLMIAGPRFSEGRLLALGAAYERATKWHAIPARSSASA